MLAPGVFAMSYDPLIGIFNTLAFPLDEQPTTLAELAAMAPELDGKIGTVNVENANAGLGTFGYIDELRRGGLGGARTARPAHRGRGRLRCAARQAADRRVRRQLLRLRLAAGADRHAPRPATSSTTATSPMPPRCRPAGSASPPPRRRRTRRRCSSTSSCPRRARRRGAPAGSPRTARASTARPACPPSRRSVGEGNAILVGYPADLAEQQAVIRGALERGVRIRGDRRRSTRGTTRPESGAGAAQAQLAARLGDAVRAVDPRV